MKWIKLAGFFLAALLVPGAASSGLIGMSGSGCSTDCSGSGGSGEALFSDEFATGDRTHTENGIAWVGQHNTTVVADPGNHTGYALRFRFSDPGAGSSHGEQRFDLDINNLGTLYTELWIKIRLVYPAEYDHEGTNNKFFRLWSGANNDGNSGYSDYWIKQGWSTRGTAEAGDGQSVLGPEWGVWNDNPPPPEGNGPVTGVGHFSHSFPGTIITTADFGTEIEWVMHYKVDTSGGAAGLSPQSTGGNGIQQIWKNGTLIHSYTTTRAQPEQPDGTTWPEVAGQTATNGWDFGYVLGADNAPTCGGVMCDYLLREMTISLTNIFGVVP